MTEVCLVGAPGGDLEGDLFAYENVRQAMAPYEHREPYPNTLAVDTVSLGAAVTLLDDLDWYLRRTVEAALVRDPSIDDAEWLSRSLAAQVRSGATDPAETGSLLRLYGVDETGLLDPMYVRRTDGTRPAYDLHDVDETVVVRVTESEFG